MLKIRGATLAGMASAARLAKLGHEVELISDGIAAGGRWAGAGASPLPPVIALPATWRDLFKKSGRTMDAELARTGLTLVPAPPTVHRFSDGSELALPTERGRQFAVLSGRYGTTVAERWRDLLDELDDVWMAARRFGVERPEAPATKAQRASLWLDRTLADAADRAGHPHLSHLVLAMGPLSGTRSRRAPGLLASRLAVDRMFGRWHLVDDAGTPQPGTRLIDALTDRLATRRVTVTDAAVGTQDQISIDCTPAVAFPSRPALAPACTRTCAEEAVGPLSETVDLSGTAPVVTWRIPSAEGTSVLIHDHTRAHRSPSWGAEPRSAGAVLRRPPVLSAGGPLRASAASPAGPEPWAELASAALAVYELHERLTGEDCRPTNRARR